MNPSIEKTVQQITPGTVLSRQLAIQKEQFHQGEMITIRDHQKEALSAISEFLASGEKAGHVEMATATGKSYLIATLAQAAADLGMRTLILAPSLRIAQQLYGEDGEKGLGKFTDLHETGRAGQRYGSNLSTRSLEQPVAVTTYQSLNSLHKAGLAPAFDLIIADEAHRSLGGVTSQTMEDFSPQAIKIGFTATPSYSDEKSLDQLLPEKIFSLDIRDSIERGLTPPISSIIYETGDEIPTFDPNRDDFSERELSALITIKARNEAIVTFAKNFVEAGMQGAVACLPGGDLAHPRLVAEQLGSTIITDKNGESRAVRAISVGAHRTQEDNERIIEAYDNGDIDVVTFVYSLEQGWDSERPQFMINASPTTSAVRETQLLGRLLRGDEEVFFVDFLDLSKKRQYTSLHVLGEETIEATRRTGRSANASTPRKSVNIGDILDSDLYEKIKLSEGKLVSQLFVGEIMSEHERLIQKWNRTLENEGLPEEPVTTFQSKDVAMRAFIKARRALGDEASIDALADYALEHQPKSQSLSYKKMYEHIETAHLHTINENMADIDDYDMFVDKDSVVEAVEHEMLGYGIDEILDSLPEREAGVIRMRYGLNTQEPMTFVEIGDEYEITGSYASVLHAEGMKKLLKPVRRKKIFGYLYDEDFKVASEKPVFTRPYDGSNVIRRDFLDEERQKQHKQAIADMTHRKNPPSRNEVLKPLMNRQRQLSDLISEERYPDPLVVDEITQIEGYIAGLYEFYDNL